MGGLDLFEGLLMIVFGLVLLCWPITLILSAQRGQWIWFVAILLLWFLAPFYFFQAAADRKKDQHTKIARQRRQERSRQQARKVAELEREVKELRERMG